jgi:hypothetical protein
MSALARVRTMQQLTVQVNIDDKQVIIAGSGVTAKPQRDDLLRVPREVPEFLGQHTRTQGED